MLFWLPSERGCETQLRPGPCAIVLIRYLRTRLPKKVGTVDITRDPSSSLVHTLYSSFHLMRKLSALSLYLWMRHTFIQTWFLGVLLTLPHVCSWLFCAGLQPHCPQWPQQPLVRCTGPDTLVQAGASSSLWDRDLDNHEVQWKCQIIAFC